MQRLLVVMMVIRFLLPILMDGHEQRKTDHILELDGSLLMIVPDLLSLKSVLLLVLMERIFIETLDLVMVLHVVLTVNMLLLVLHTIISMD